MLSVSPERGVAHARVLEADFSGTCSPENSHYLLKVLRLRAGGSFFVTDGRGKEASAVLNNDGTYTAGAPVQPGREPGIDVRLFAAITKGDRFEFVIEKAVELGVTTIVPLISERTVVGVTSLGKLQRWEKIAVAAMLQCGGCLKPVIANPVELKALPRPEAEGKALFLHEKSSSETTTSLSRSGKTSLWLVSGPEGGFSQTEVDTLLKSGWKAVWLGPRLFRADTAPIVALARILLPPLLV